MKELHFHCEQKYHKRSIICLICPLLIHIHKSVDDHNEMDMSFLVTDVVETKFNQMFSDLPSRLFPAQGARSALQRRAEEKEQFDQQVHIFCL